MTSQEKRIASVLEGLLPDEALSDDDIRLLQERVQNAIAEKFSSGKMIMHEGIPRTVQ